MAILEHDVAMGIRPLCADVVGTHKGTFEGYGAALHRGHALPRGKAHWTGTKHFINTYTHPASDDSGADENIPRALDGVTVYLMG